MYMVLNPREPLNSLKKTSLIPQLLEEVLRLLSIQFELHRQVHLQGMRKYGSGRNLADRTSLNPWGRYCVFVINGKLCILLVTVRLFIKV